MTKIRTELPIEVIAVLAEACGFRVDYDRSPDVDEWTLSAGHGDNHVQHVGTRTTICAFLCGYAAMQLQTTQILNEIDQAQHALVVDMRARLKRGRKAQGNV